MVPTEKRLELRLIMPRRRPQQTRQRKIAPKVCTVSIVNPPLSYRMGTRKRVVKINL